MRQLIYSMHFTGTASSSREDRKMLRLLSSGASCQWQTRVTPAGLEATVQPTEGDLAFLDSEVHLKTPDSFEGQGTLSFGEEGEHSLRFRTIEAGHFAPSQIPGVMAGAASWRIEGGSGRFAAAAGFITSTFTLSESGEWNEYHCGLIFVRD